MLDRTKEPGAPGEPLYQDVVTALAEAGRPRPAARHRRALRARLEGVHAGDGRGRPRRASPSRRPAPTSRSASSTTSPHLASPSSPTSRPSRTTSCARCSTASAPTARSGRTRTRSKIIGEHTDLHAQGYFVYDSKKSGSITVSHLRFGPAPIRSTYLVAAGRLRRVPPVRPARPHRRARRRRGRARRSCSTPPTGPTRSGSACPCEAQEQILGKGLAVLRVDATPGRTAGGLGKRVNTVLQTCFFALSGVLPLDEAIAAIKGAIQHTYGKRGEAVVDRNFAAVDSALRAARVAGPRVAVRPTRTRPPGRRPPVAPDFVRRVTAAMLAGRGDLLPVSALPSTAPSRSAPPASRSAAIAEEIPIWDPVDLHRLRQVRPRLPPRGDPDEGLRRRGARGRARRASSTRTGATSTCPG